MKFSYPIALTGILGTTYSIGQEEIPVNLTTTQTSIVGYMAEMASHFDYKTQEK